MTGFLVDTSIFIAGERQESLGAPPPGKARISVMTLTELLIGARSVRGAIKVGREKTLGKAKSFVSLPYDEMVAEAAATLTVAARRDGRRASYPDVIIAATALAHGLTLWTLDHDFAVLAEVEPALQVHRA